MSRITARIRNSAEHQQAIRQPVEIFEHPQDKRPVGFPQAHPVFAGHQTAVKPRADALANLESVFKRSVPALSSQFLQKQNTVGDKERWHITRLGERRGELLAVLPIGTHTP